MFQQAKYLIPVHIRRYIATTLIRHSVAELTNKKVTTLISQQTPDQGTRPEFL